VESPTPLPGALGAALIMTATNSTLCCANVEGAPITPDNPASSGEVIYVFATGLGLVNPAAANSAIIDGTAYSYTQPNTASGTVSVQAAGATADVISAGLLPGAIGIYEVVFQIDSTVISDPHAQVTVGQDIYISNVVTIPLVNQNPPLPSLCE